MLGKGAVTGCAASEKRAALAQLVEHLIRNEGVTGSSPVSGTTPSEQRLQHRQMAVVE